MGYGGVQMESDFSVSSNGVRIARVIEEWRDDKVQWRENSTDFASNHVDNIGMYSLQGMLPNTVFSVSDNGEIRYKLTSDADGKLAAFSIALTNETHTILVCGPAGILFIFQ